MSDGSGITKTAGSFIDAMKTQPLALALCVMNFALVAFLFYQNKGFTEQRQENIAQFIEYQKEVQRILATCAARSEGAKQGDPT